MRPASTISTSVALVLVASSAAAEPAPAPAPAPAKVPFTPQTIAGRSPPGHFRAGIWVLGSWAGTLGLAFYLEGSHYGGLAAWKRDAVKTQLGHGACLHPRAAMPIYNCGDLLDLWRERDKFYNWAYVLWGVDAVLTAIGVTTIWFWRENPRPESAAVRIKPVASADSHGGVLGFRGEW